MYLILLLLLMACAPTDEQERYVGYWKHPAGYHINLHEQAEAERVQAETLRAEQARYGHLKNRRRDDYVIDNLRIVDGAQQEREAALDMAVRLKCLIDQGWNIFLVRDDVVSETLGVGPNGKLKIAERRNTRKLLFPENNP